MPHKQEEMYTIIQSEHSADTHSDLPLVSIIIPAYNAAPLLSKTLDSIIQQDYPNWEVLLINDHSTDNTQEIIDQYHQQYPEQIHSFQTEGLRKPSAVRNVGLKKAKGPFITFLDADDEFFPDSLPKLLTPMIQDPTINGVFGFPFCIDDQGQPRDALNNRIRWKMSQFTLDWKTLCRFDLPYNSTISTRKTVVETMGFLDETLLTCEDFQYLMRLCLLGLEKIHYLGDFSFRYRKHEGTVTRNLSHIMASLESVDNVLDWLFSQPQLPQEARRCRPKTTGYKYKLVAQNCLLMESPTLARKVCLRGLSHKAIPIVEWLRSLGPIFVLSILPSNLILFLSEASKKIRHYFLYQSAQIPA